jgi:hypothetical protein
MATHQFIEEYSKCKNCPHLKWAHIDPELVKATCGKFEFQDNLQFLEYKVWLKEKNVKTYWGRLRDYCSVFRFFKLLSSNKKDA